MKEILRAILQSPPTSNLLSFIGGTRTGKRILSRVRRPPWGVFENFSEGWKAARKTGLPAHEDPNEITLHLELSKGLRVSDYSVLYWLLRLSKDRLKIFDFGGNVGNLAYSYSAYLRDVRELEWTVFDLPSIMREGHRLAGERQADYLRFASSAADFRADQILLISGAFHYWEGTVEAFLRQFGEKPSHILLNRSPIHETKASFISVQGTGTCAFPCIVRNAREMIGDFAAQGYELVDRWQAPELAFRLMLFPGYAISSYSGFYFAQRKH
jgi:putative methyltransferase (TIGR04325 family)